jgi:hypothetical protein
MSPEKILQTTISSDPALRGFTPGDLPTAARARVAVCLAAGSLDTKFSSSDLDILEQWSGEMNAILATAVASPGEGECTYYVFADGSLYFRSSGDSEVWADAVDFATERILNGYDGPLDSMDHQLLIHLGGSMYEREIAERGVRE